MNKVSAIRLIRIFKVCLLSCHVIWAQTIYGQQGVTTFGLEYCPIIPNTLIGYYQQDFTDVPMESSMRQKFGNHFGGIVRHGFTRNFSFETGLGFTQRNFNLSFAIPDSSFAEEDDVRIVCYSVPVSGLVFIQLADRIFMNTSMGASMNLFPSAVQVFVPVTGTNHHFLMEAVYKTKLQGSLLANLGLEFRTDSKGYFYFGATYNLPFSPICQAALAFEHAGGDFVATDYIKGSFLSVDLRYYFNEVKEKKFGDRSE